MDDHTDGVWCTAINPKSLTQFVSGACDGEMRVWDLSLQKSVWSGYVHEGYVRGVTVSRDGRNYFSCGDDKLIKQWRIDSDFLQQNDLVAGKTRGKHHLKRKPIPGIPLCLIYLLRVRYITSRVKRVGDITSRVKLYQDFPYRDPIVKCVGVSRVI